MGFSGIRQTENVVEKNQKLLHKQINHRRLSSLLISRGKSTEGLNETTAVVNGGRHHTSAIS